MAKRSLDELMASAPDIDPDRIVETTEQDIRRQAREDGDDPDAEAAGYVTIPLPGELRRSLGMTQDAFAAFLRVPVGTVRNWEQGRTPPDPAARTLLALVAADPDRAIALLGRPCSDRKSRHVA